MQQLCLQQLLFSYSVLPLSMVRHTSWFISASVLLWDLYRYAPHWLTVVFMWIRVTLLKKLGYKCFPSVHFGLVWQVMSVKALGIALKLTFSGMNQLVYPQTWVFLFVVVSCIVTQMNYLNKVCSILWSCTHMNWKFVLHLGGLKIFALCILSSVLHYFQLAKIKYCRPLTHSTLQLFRPYITRCLHPWPFWLVL